jgi:hypothetical protein
MPVHVVRKDASVISLVSTAVFDELRNVPHKGTRYKQYCHRTFELARATDTIDNTATA